MQARLAGAISGEGDRGVRRAIHGTIMQLQKTSNNPHSLGRRYATSLRLLWRKSTGKPSDKPAAHDDMQGLVEPSPSLSSGQEGLMPSLPVAGVDPLNGFSWRDLDSLGQYIANNTTMNMMTDGTMTGTDYDWEHSSGGLDDLTMQPQFETMWNSNDLVF